MKKYLYVVLLWALAYGSVQAFIAPETPEGDEKMRTIDFTEDYDPVFTSSEDKEMDEENIMSHQEGTQRPYWFHNSYTQSHLPRWYFGNAEEID